MSGRNANRQRGMALVTAILVAGVVAAIAYAVSTRDQVLIRRTENLLAAGQARAHARGVELWALGVLRRDLEASTAAGAGAGAGAATGGAGTGGRPTDAASKAGDRAAANAPPAAGTPIAGGGGAGATAAPAAAAVGAGPRGGGVPGAAAAPPAVDHYGEAWARPIGPLQVVGGAVSGRIVDLQGRWNINNLFAAAPEQAGAEAAAAGAGADQPGATPQADGPRGGDGGRPSPGASAGRADPNAGGGRGARGDRDADAPDEQGRGAAGGRDGQAAEAADAAAEPAAPVLNEQQLEILLCLLARAKAPPGLADAIVDWLDADAEPSGRKGAEDAWYLRQQPARRAANAPLSDTAELRLVRGMDAATFARLEPMLTAAPGMQTVNVNTATPDVLACLVPMPAIAPLVQGRPWTDTGDFAKLPVLGAVPVPAGRLGVTSQMFEIETLVQLDRAMLLTRTRVSRDETGALSVLSRRRGWPNE